MKYKLINTGYIEEVCDNSQELIAEMVSIFSEQVSEFSEEMQRMNEEGNYHELALMAHKAKASIAIMGMDDLAAKLKELEINSKEGINTETYPVLINDFINQTGTAVKELEEYLDTL